MKTAIRSSPRWFVPVDLTMKLFTMRLSMFVVLCAMAGSTASATLAAAELNSTLELHSAPQQHRLRGWQPRNLFARQTYCTASDGYRYTCSAYQRCCPGHSADLLCLNDLRLTCCPDSNQSCPTVNMCCGVYCCPEGTYCTSALTCAYRSTTTSRPSTSTKATETNTRPTSAAKDENQDTPEGGLSRSDKIAIGVGLGVGIPTMAISFIAMCLMCPCFKN